MNKKEIKSVWAAFLEVQEAKKKALDPVGKEDGDVDNDGDEDSSDEYLANRRKAVGKAMKKEGSEESPYPSLDKKKREKKGSNLEDAGGPAAKLKGEAVEKGKKVVCPKCKGDGCDHCDGEGEHVKEDYIAFVESLDNDELAEYTEWLLEDDDQLDELSTDTLKSYSKKALKSQDYHDDAGANSKPGSAQRKKHDRKLNNRIKGADRADQKVFDRQNPHESTNMDRYVDALRSIPNDQIDELSTSTLKSYQAKSAASGKDHMAKSKAARDAGNDTARKAHRTKAIHRQDGHDLAQDKIDAKKKSVRHVSSGGMSGQKRTRAGHSYREEFELDELSTKTMQSYSNKVSGSIDKLHKKGNDAEKRGDHKAAQKHDDKAERRADHQDRADAKIAKRKKQAGMANSVSSGGMSGQKRTAAGHSYRSEAFDIINSVFEMRELAHLESVLSPAELAGIEEKMQPNSSGTKSEPFMSTSSAGEKKFYADHEKGSEKKYEDWEETGEKDAVKAGRGVKSQSPTRRGEKRQSETMGKVK